jgi:hypothetical protein
MELHKVPDDNQPKQSHQCNDGLANANNPARTVKHVQFIDLLTGAESSPAL